MRNHVLPAALSSVLALSLSACAANTTGEDRSGHASDALSCTDPQTRTYELEASLAVAVAQELRRWEPDLDFEIDGETYSVRLTSVGYDQCSANGSAGCPVVSELLGLQFHGEPEIRGHDANQFRDVLYAHMMRYLAYRSRSSSPRVDGVTLSATTVTAGPCGPMNWFVSSDPDASKLWSKMIAYGGRDALGQEPENPFLNFSTSGRLVGIDPNNDMTGGSLPTSSGVCSTARSVIDLSGAKAGLCCFLDGRYGRYVRVLGTRSVYACSLAAETAW